METPKLETIRKENDARLLSRVDAIRSGRDINGLEMFAKAYLGSLLILDNAAPPRERIHDIASASLADAIFDGLAAALQQERYPSPQQIAAAIGGGKPDPLGFVMLAGMDLVAEQGRSAVLSQTDQVLRTALCFHFAHASKHRSAWPMWIVGERPDIAGPALLALWGALIDHGDDFLPGLSEVMASTDCVGVRDQILPMLLRRWDRVADKTLLQMLHVALHCLDHHVLLPLFEEKLAATDIAQVRRKVYWLTAAYVLAPEKYAEALMDYMGRTREKVMRLLDFVYPPLNNGDIELDPMALARVIRIVAPVIRPHQDSREVEDDNMPKVLWLIDELKKTGDRDALDWLKAVRVMKVYEWALR